jgi:hypothetical protein
LGLSNEGMKRAALSVYTPLGVALRHGRASHGTAVYELTDDDVQVVPEELRAELVYWVERHAGQEEPRALALDHPDVTIENIVAALSREASARRRKDPEWVRDSFHVQVAAQQYVIDQQVPDAARAAREGYDVRRVALEHFARAIAAFDEDAIILPPGTPEQDHARFDERRRPSEHAFAFVDRLRDHIDALPKPGGVSWTPPRVQRYRPAVLKEHRGVRKWGAGEPGTVVTVTVTTIDMPSWIIVFVAES